jgi:hypothetical protein
LRNYIGNYLGNYLGNHFENLRDNHFCGIIFNGYPLGINHRKIAGDPFKLWENHLESIGETLFKTAFGNALTTARCCRILQPASPPRCCVQTRAPHAAEDSRLKDAPEANACGDVGAANCWSGCKWGK